MARLRPISRSLSESLSNYFEFHKNRKIFKRHCISKCANKICLAKTLSRNAAKIIFYEMKASFSKTFHLQKRISVRFNQYF
jgi:hypothetical protein